MVFTELLALVEKEPLFETGFLLVGAQNSGYVRRQLSEWVRLGKLWQLRRGLYGLAPPFQKVTPHPFYVANQMVSGSYVSLQSALAYYGMIPEYVPAVTSVTSRKSNRWTTPFGEMIFRTLRPNLLFGYKRVLVASEQEVFIATPEKSLLDLIYLQPGGDDEDFLRSLRLQNLSRLNLERFEQMAHQFHKPKLDRAVPVVATLAIEERDHYKPL